jgi:hypothetical protein
LAVSVGVDVDAESSADLFTTTREMEQRSRHNRGYREPPAG